MPLKSIVDTWARKCDGFIAGSNFTDAALHAVNIPHPGKEEYANMWQKLRSMWGYVHRHYADKFDWFYVCGDDTFVMYENLAAYLTSEQLVSAVRKERELASHRTPAPKPVDVANVTALLGDTPLMVGQKIPPNRMVNEVFIGGGGGYVLNSAALKLFGSVMHTEKCSPDVQLPEEDLLMSR